MWGLVSEIWNVVVLVVLGELVISLGFCLLGLVQPLDKLDEGANLYLISALPNKTNHKQEIA